MCVDYTTRYKSAWIVDAEELKRKHTVVLEQARPLDLNSEAHAAKEPTFTV
jgi:hypothetical protein